MSFFKRKPAIDDRDPVNVVGLFFMRKWRDRLTKSTPAKVLAQMQKQGIPPEVATVILYAK